MLFNSEVSLLCPDYLCIGGSRFLKSSTIIGLELIFAFTFSSTFFNEIGCNGCLVIIFLRLYYLLGWLFP